MLCAVCAVRVLCCGAAVLLLLLWRLVAAPEHRWVPTMHGNPQVLDLV
jgi:hypothetical protein